MKITEYRLVVNLCNNSFGNLLPVVFVVKIRIDSKSTKSDPFYRKYVVFESNRSNTSNLNNDSRRTKDNSKIHVTISYRRFVCFS